MPSRTSRARLRAPENRAPAAGVRHSFCRPTAHRGALFPEEYCARSAIRPADSSDLLAFRSPFLPEPLRMRLTWDWLDRARPTVALLSTLRCRLRRAATARPSLLVRENSGCSL